MLEFTGIASVLRAVSLVYWLLAIGSLALVLWKVKGRWRKAAGALAVVAVFSFLPTKHAVEHYQREAFSREAWSYFKKLCTEKAGEKIYRKSQDANSVLVLKPLPPASENDLYDQYWYGDPYSNATPSSERGKSTATVLTLGSQQSGRARKGFDFIEIRTEAGGSERYQRVNRPISNQDRAVVEQIDKPVSRFGIAWEDISTPADRKYWVAGSRLKVIDLTDNSVMAERTGYFIEAGFGSRGSGRRPWLTSRGPNTTCPPVVSDYTDQWFLLKVLRGDD